MSLKKSETSIANVSTGWAESLLSNVALPILLLLTIPIGALLENRHVVGPYYTRIVTVLGYNLILAVSLQLINGFSGQFSLGHAGFMAVGAYLAAYPAKAYADSHNHLSDPASILLFYIALGVALAIITIGLGAIFLLLQQSRRIANWAPVVLLLLLLFWMLADMRAAAVQAGNLPSHLFWSRALSFVTGSFNGIISDGQPHALKVTAMLPETMRAPLAFLVLIGGGGLCAAVAGFIIGLPALRLRGDYLAIATLGMAEIIRIIIQNSQPLGGALGLTGIPRYTNMAWLYGAVFLTTVVIWRIAYSAKGRAIQAVREDEIAAAAVGVNPTRQKVTAFIVGAFFAGVAGVLFALNEYSITPTRFTLDRSIEVVAMVTLGGLGSISGAILAAIVLTILPEVLRPIAELRMVIYSILLVAMMLVRPQGLLGGYELWPRRGLFRRRSIGSVTPTTDESMTEKPEPIAP